MSQPTDRPPYSPVEPPAPQWHAQMPPAPMYPQPAAPPPAPWKPKSRKDWWLKGPGLVILFALAALPLGALAALSGAGGDAGTTTGTSKVQVQITSCELGDLTGNVTLQVTNQTSREQDVRVDLEYRDSSGRRLDTDTAWIRNVPAGDVVLHDEPTFLDAGAGGGTCKITAID